jgi:hypothetical protein
VERTFCASMDSNEQRMRRLQYKHRKMQLVNMFEEVRNRTRNEECDEFAHN